MTKDMRFIVSSIGFYEEYKGACENSPIQHSTDLLCETIAFLLNSYILEDWVDPKDCTDEDLICALSHVDSHENDEENLYSNIVALRDYKDAAWDFLHKDGLPDAIFKLCREDKAEEDNGPFVYVYPFDHDAIDISITGGDW